MKVLLPVTLGIVLLGCTETTSEKNVVDPLSPVLKIAISVEGAITLDGAEVTLDDLRARLSEASGTGAVVWYSGKKGMGNRPKRPCW